MTDRDDEDAAWRSIIEHYGERPALPDDDPRMAEPRSTADFVESTPAEPFSRVEPVETNDLNSPATWDDEGHFIPPDPPPPPQPQGIRKWAWIGLFGSPTLMLVAVVFGVAIPGVLLMLLAGAFVGGFGYLVATMNRRPPDDWSGDNGAVV